MGVLTKLGDSLRNVVANLGTDRDKATGSQYVLPILSDPEADAAYRGAWLPRKIVDIPAKDACRKWRTWNASADEISKIEAEEKRLGLQAKVLQAMILARLRGGAAIYIGTGDADPSKELKPERIGAGGLRHINVLSRRVLQAGELETDPESAQYGRPRGYTLSSAQRQVEIHPSRLVIFHGAPVPDPEMTAGSTFGWGDPVLLAITAAIKAADSTVANVASMVFEAKVDVIQIPDLMQNLANGGKEYEKQLLDRLALAATAKGINGALVLDALEKYEQKELSFAQLPEVIQTFLQVVSGAADIPVTRLLGQSPGGLNTTGESDLRNYYDGIQSMQELVLQPALAVLDECLIRSALGRRPPEAFFNWRSLWQTTDKERADIGKITAETIKIIDDTGLLPDAVMSQVAQNMLTEAGVAPGLESAMEEFGEYDPERDPQEGAEGGEGEDADPRSAVTDAAPRSLYVRRDVVNVAEIKAWAAAQGIEDVADDLHVTIAYSRQPFDWIAAGNAREWTENGKDELIIAEGGPRAVEPLGGMSAVILFASSQLAWRHEEIKRAGASHDFPDYTPHISLTKVPTDLSKIEPYRGRIVLGPEIFEQLRDDQIPVADAAKSYDPSQPRAPAGSGNGGQWVSGNGGDGDPSEEMPEVPDGHQRFFHGSPEGNLGDVEDKGVFGGVFASGSEGSALSHIHTREGALYYADIAEGDILTQRAFEYEIDHDRTMAALRKSMPGVPGDDLDLAYEVVVEQRDVWGRDEADVFRVFGGDDMGEASFEGQRIRGRVARELGYKAVEMDDEHGTSYLILPGAKLRRVPGT